MTFHEGGSFEGGRVRKGGGGGAKIAAGGGGLVAVIVALVVIFSGGKVDPSALTGGAPAAEDSSQEFIGDCTVEQANTDAECRLSATVQSLDTYWQQTVTAAGGTFAVPEVQSFSGSTNTACGPASASTGPFYCPPDQTIYLDVGFFDELQSRFGAEGGPLAEEYVEAHEYGHHIQQITGVMDRAQRGGGGATSDSVRVELQADCYAGMWAGSAASTIDPDRGVPFLDPITPAELEQALSAAEAVGDDHIQKQSGGGVNPDTWTHGSSEQRQRWFTTGYQQGTFAACDTFSASRL